MEMMAAMSVPKTLTAMMIIVRKAHLGSIMAISNGINTASKVACAHKE